MYSFFDGHCDTITTMFENGSSLYRNNLHIDIERLLAYKNPTQVFAVWLKPEYYKTAYSKTLQILSFYYKELENNKSFIMPVFRYEDIGNNKENNKISAILSLEGAESVLADLNRIPILYHKGVRMMSLTWNHRNILASGVLNEYGSLTDMGANALSMMEDMGIIVDVSHLNQNSFWEVARLCKNPIVASHSNPKQVCNVKRNLTDGQIRAIASKGGVIGINLNPPFLGKDSINIELILEHIEHLAKVGGYDCPGLGCDFDGIVNTPPHIKGCQDIKILLNSIEKKFGVDFLDKIAEKNFLRVAKEVWK